MDEQAMAALLDAALRPILERLDVLGKRQVVPPDLPTRDAALYLGVGVDTLEKYRKLGLVSYRNASPPGSGKPRYRYLVADLDRIIQQGYRRDVPRPAKPPARRRQEVRPQNYQHLDLD